MDKELLNLIIPGIGTILGAFIAGWFGLRLGRVQTDLQRKINTDLIESSDEIEFRKSLLELIEKQESKLTHQEQKIEKLETQTDTSRTLIDELKRANLALTIENQHLKRRIAEQEQEVSVLRSKVEPLIRGDA